MGSYEMVINALKAQASFEDESLYKIHIKKLTWQERLRLSNYLNSVVYNFDENYPPRMDKTIFSMRSRK
jgi:hypothetical protein